MTMRLNVKSNASAGNVTLNIYDETNAANIVASEQLQLSNDTAGALSKVGFTIPATCTSLSYTITALPEAGSPVTRVDDIIAELAVTSLLETSVEVPVVTEWQGYTPTFQGFGTPTAIEFEWRQVGQDVEIRGKFTSGTVTAVEGRIGLPGGLTSAGTSLIPSIQIVGNAARGENGVAGAYNVLIEPSVSYVTFALGSSTTSGLAKVNGANLVNAGASFALFAKVPCAGLSATTTKTIDLTQSGLVQNSDDVLVVSGNAGQSITANVTDIPFANVQNSIGSVGTWNGTQLTILESGIYSFHVGVQFTTSLARAVRFAFNGVNSTNIGDYYAGGIHIGSYTGYLTAGTVVSVRVENAGGTLTNTTQHRLEVSRQSSLKQVSVSSDQKIKIPTSELRFEGASSRGAVATSIVRFATLAKIRGDAFTVTSTANDGTFVTMRKSGMLDVTASIVMPTATTVRITKNQTNLTSSGTASEIMASETQGYSGTANVSITYSGFVAAGDIIRVTADLNPTSFDTNSFNLSFQEQDIAVSVTNTLPQFSESDSSVRVDTANGYGSSGTRIRRFSNIRENIGTDIEYIDSATDGARFVVKSDGIYNISYSESCTAAFYAGITKNSSSLTTNVSDLPDSEVLAIGYTPTATSSATASWQGYLTVGDIIRPQSNGIAASVNPVVFTISKVGKPNVTGVDVTPFVKIPQPIIGTARLVGHSAYSSGQIFDSIQNEDSQGLFTINNNSPATTITFNKNCYIDVHYTRQGSVMVNNATYVYIHVNGNTVAAAGSGSSGNTDTECQTVSFSGKVYTGDVITFIQGGVGVNAPAYGDDFCNANIKAQAASDSIITASESFSTDTASLQYAGSGAYTLSTLANAPVGTFITFTYAANTNTRTQTTTAPTQTTASMNVNGIQVFGRAYNAASTAASPSVVAIQVGKGFKGWTGTLYAGLSKTNSISYDFYASGTASEIGALYRSYDELTGILTFDAGVRNSTSNTTHFMGVAADITSPTNGYLVINASKSPALVGVPLLQPRIALVSNVLASNASTQVIPGSTWTTVNINTLNDPSGVVTGLASNQISLLPGQYYFESFVSLLSNSSVGTTNGHTRIRNITAGSTSLSGHKVQFINLANVTDIPSLCQGYVTITTPSVFEIQTFLSSGAGGNIGGASVADTSENKTPVLIKITKVK
jgi:hypothetical protein